MTDIYTQHDTAFSNVSAYVIMKDGEQVGKLAFKFPKDGAGRLWCYFHLIGLEMVRGYAGGYGYDKRSAAVQAAIENMKDYDFSLYKEPYTMHQQVFAPNLNKEKALLQDAFKNIGGKDWQDVFRDNGYTVLSAV